MVLIWSMMVTSLVAPVKALEDDSMVHCYEQCSLLTKEEYQRFSLFAHLVYTVVAGQISMRISLSAGRGGWA